MSRLGSILSGYKIVIRDPVAVHKGVYMLKKHRKKKNLSPKLKVFSHFVDIVENGQVITDKVNRVMYMSSTTRQQLKQAAEHY